jgi:hypothetical protein
VSTLPGNGPDAQVPPGSRSGDSSIPGCCQTRDMTARYIGSGPYCYANCVAMALADGTDPGLLEVLTGSPFGLELLGGRRPLFNPLGWDPQIGIDAALDLLGWSCQRGDGGDADAALTRLRHAAGCGPVLAGPVEMGLPGSLGTGQAALALARLARAGLADDQREELAWFAVRAGARRLADAEHWLGQIGLHHAAMIAGAQARLVGGLQYPLVTGDDAAIAAMMRDLAPTYRQLRDALTA